MSGFNMFRLGLQKLKTVRSAKVKITFESAKFLLHIFTIALIFFCFKKPHAKSLVSLKILIAEAWGVILLSLRSHLKF